MMCVKLTPHTRYCLCPLFTKAGLWHPLAKKQDTPQILNDFFMKRHFDSANDTLDFNASWKLLNIKKYFRIIYFYILLVFKKVVK